MLLCPLDCSMGCVLIVLGGFVHLVSISMRYVSMRLCMYVVSVRVRPWVFVHYSMSIRECPVECVQESGLTGELSGLVGVIVLDPWLQSQLTQVELHSLNSKFVSLQNQSGKITLEDLPPVLVKVKSLSFTFKENELRLGDLSSGHASDDLDFESFLRVSLNFFCVVFVNLFDGFDV